MCFLLPALLTAKQCQLPGPRGKAVPADDGTGVGEPFRAEVSANLRVSPGPTPYLHSFVQIIYLLLCLLIYKVVIIIIATS